ISSIPSRLKNADVLYLCTNKPMDDEKARRAIYDFVNAGKGMVIVHAGLWYNWRDWPEYNRELVGGGTRRHDNYQEFKVTAVAKDHPILEGVAADFTIKDELYHFIEDPHGSWMNVLLEASLPNSEKKYASVWITEHPRARIACI